MSKVECTEGLIVDVVPLHGSVSTMIQRATKAKVTRKDEIWLLPSINQREQSIINITVIVQILEFYSSNLIIQGLSNDRSKSKLISRDFEEAHLYVIFYCRGLRQFSSHDVPSC